MLSLNSNTNDVSVVLNITRYMSALAVCFGHAISIWGVQERIMPSAAPYMQNLAVIIFFIVSGFLIAHVLTSSSREQNYSLKHYLVDRFVRIYSAYLPALFFIALIEYIYVLLGGKGAYTGVGIFIGNVFMLQNYLGPFKDLLAVPSYGSAGQLWTLSIEFYIYIFVGSLFFLINGKQRLFASVLFGVCVFVIKPYFSADTHGLPGEGLFVLWLLGFAIYFCVKNANPLHRSLLHWA